MLVRIRSAAKVRTDSRASMPEATGEATAVLPDRQVSQQQLLDQYRQIARAYLESAAEAELYKVSLLGHEFVRQELGPIAIVEVHFSVLDELLAEHDSGSWRGLVRQLSTLLLEAMMVYGASHQQVRDLLEELRGKYAELDRTKRELEASRDELRQRTSDLIQTEKMTALGELSAAVAHEINQPLNATKIICQDLWRDLRKDRLDLETLSESLAEVLEQVGMVAEIVDHLRVFTRKTAGTKWSRFDINRAVSGVMMLIGQQLRTHGIEVTKDLGENLLVDGDVVQLEQVLMNLLTNARDAVMQAERPAGRWIRIRTARIVADGASSPMLLCEVSDNGDGIPAAVRARVFESFFTTKPSGEGTGLGLSVSKKIVEEHGGQITVESEQGSGTIFQVTLPLAAGGA